MEILAISIFVAALIAIIFEVFDKAIIALIGALLFVLTGILTPEAAVEAIDFETILLLMAMMMVVDIARRSGIFSWLTVKVAKITAGNPILILVLFSFITLLCSAFLDNVTTILLVVPVTVALTKGMGLDPKMYVITEAMFSNVGGTLTLIGDPSNIIIGTQAGLTFNQFLINQSIPVLVTAVLVVFSVALVNWKSLKPISNNLQKLFLSSMLIKKVEYTFLQVDLKKSFVIKSVGVLFLTLLGFTLHAVLGLPVHIIALTGATVLLFVTQRYSTIHDALLSVEWPTLIFFAGLFVMVGGMESVGILNIVADWIGHLTNDYFSLVLIILWCTGFISMVVNTVPFITVMVPVIFGIQDNLLADPNFAAQGHDLNLLWWALSIGACLGGNGTIVGASANIVTVDVAKKEGVRIGFFEFLKYGFPVSMLGFTVATVYFYFRIFHFS